MTYQNACELMAVKLPSKTASLSSMDLIGLQRIPHQRLSPCIVTLACKFGAKGGFGDPQVSRMVSVSRFVPLNYFGDGSMPFDFQTGPAPIRNICSDLAGSICSATLGIPVDQVVQFWISDGRYPRILMPLS